MKGKQNLTQSQILLSSRPSLSDALNDQGFRAPVLHASKWCGYSVLGERDESKESWCGASQSVVSRPASSPSPGNFLQMPTLGPCPRSPEADTRLGSATCTFTSPVGDFEAPQTETHCSNEWKHWRMHTPFPLNWEERSIRIRTYILLSDLSLLISRFFKK